MALPLKPHREEELLKQLVRREGGERQSPLEGRGDNAAHTALAPVADGHCPDVDQAFEGAALE
eukprot:8028153-Heterocapsa_arctica.AAC.1